MFFLGTFLFILLICSASYIVFYLFSRVGREVFQDSGLIIFSFIIGPIFVSYCLFYLLLLFPGKTDAFYKAAIIVPFSAFCAFTHKNCLGFVKRTVHAISAFFRVVYSRRMYFWLISVIMILIGLKAICFPIVSDDAINYALAGKYLYQVKSLQNYPMITESASGLIIAHRHPPGQMLLYTLSYFLTGSDAYDYIPRGVTFYYCLLLAIVLGYFVYRFTQNLFAAYFSVLVCLSTPLTVEMAIFNTLDPARITFMLLIGYFFYEFFRTGRNNTAYLSSFVLACGLFIHLSMLLIIILAISFFIGNNYLLTLISREKGKRTEFRKIAAPAFAISILLGILPLFPHYMKLVMPNIQETAVMNVKADSGPVVVMDDRKYSTSIWRKFTTKLFFGKVAERHIIWREQAEKDWAYYLKYWLNILESTLNHVGYNLGTRLSPFTRVVYFSFSFWLWIIVTVLIIKNRSRQSNFTLYLVMFNMVAFGAILLIRYGNPRYIYTIFPFTCLLIGVGYEYLAQLVEKKRIFRWASILFLAFLFAAPLLTLTARKGNLLYLFQSRDMKLVSSTRDFLGARDYFKALQYIEKNLSHSGRVLVFRQAPFFYYTTKKGLAFKYTNKLKSFRKHYYHSGDYEKAYRELRAADCSYILTDPNYEMHTSYQNSIFPKLYDSDYAKLVFQSNLVRLYKLKE